MKNLTFTIIITLAAFSGILGQSDPIDPKRGSVPGASMSISDIENINLTNGNLMLNMPLVSLPKGRGGLSASFGMVYNSKVFKPIVEEVMVSNEMTDQNFLYPSDEGGWRATNSLDFILKLTDRFDGGSLSAIDCANTQHIQKNAYIYKVQVTMPDGGDKEFRPVGYSSYNGDGFDDGYFNFSAYGKLRTYTGYPTCGTSETTVTTNPIAYYSADGSNIRMVVDPTNLSFTLYFPDGSYYQSSNSRLTDRYGNYIQKMSPFTYSGKTANGIEDSVGRRIFYTAGDQSGETFYYSEGVTGTAIKWAVRTKTIYVRKQYQTTANAGIRDRGGSSSQTIDTSFDVVSEIILPSQLGTNRKYTFAYSGSDTALSGSQYSSGYGELTSVEMPSEATATYEYVNSIENTDRILAQGVTKKTLTYDNEYDGQTTSASDVWTYSYNFTTYATTTVVSPDGSSMTQDHYSTKTQIPLNGHVRRIVNPTSKVEKVWATNATPWGGVNSFVKQEFTSIKDANGNYTLTAIKEFAQDKNGGTTSVKEYDFVPYANVPRDGNGYPTGLPSGATAYRNTSTVYNNSTPDSSDTTTNATYGYWNHPAIKGVAASSEILNSSNQTVSKTELTYDNYSTTANPILTRTWNSSVSLTTPLTDSNSVKTQATYHSTYGFPLTTTDANGVVTTYTYGCIDGSTGGCSSTAPDNLYPTKTEVASNHTSLMRTSSAKYDYYTGVVTEAKDVDNDIATATEYDVLGRPTKVRSADGKPLESWTRTTYDDDNRRVIVESDLETKGDYKKVATQFFDQLGRVRLAKTLEDASTQSATNETDGIKVQTRYKTVSGYTYQLLSNPYRASTSSAESDATMGWTLSTVWSNGIRSEVQTFSGAGLPTAFGGSNTTSTGVVRTDIDANATTVTDQAGKLRRSITNGLGQLTRVDEPNSSNQLGSVSSPNQATNYTYNTLGKMVRVEQGSQNRYFMYDSLGRTLRIRQPEQEVNTALNTSGDPYNNSWTGGFTYDNNGNVLTTTDAKGTTITSTYDALNRPLTRTYNDSPQTATVTNTYGTTAPAIGQLIKVSSSVSETQYSGFDVLGRLTESKQITPLDGETISTAPVRTSSYQYNLSGALIQQTYPSGRVVETDLDASGDIANVTSKKNSSAIFGTFANNFSYTAAGAISSMRLGNGKWENTKYNTRLQPIEMGLGASSTDAGAWKVSYEYGELQTNGTVDATTNSGNIGKQTLTVPVTSFVTAYKYDPLNRLTEAQEKTGSTQNWIQTFGYDVYGNRTSFSQTIGSTTTSTTPTVNASTNRFNTGQGFTYDANGNVTQDVDAVSSHTRSFTFNGDNKQTQVKDVTNSNHVVGTYYYDGEGRRVKKVTDTETTVFVYALGRIVAEYSTQISSTPSVAYTTSDHLGSPRVITNEQSQVESRRDFMPFGEELYTGVGGRSSGMNYGSSADDVRQKFTGYQRDSETNLDFAEARMYENRFGRFTAVDPLLASGKSADPRTFNRYVYVRNAPLRLVDPSGLISVNPDIIIIENGPTTPKKGEKRDSSDSKDGNPIGHTAIAITGKGVFSAGNGEKEPQTDAKNNILGGSVKDYLTRELSRRDTKITIIKTTPEQDEAVASKFIEISKSKEKLTAAGIMADNCSTRANEALDASGLKGGKEMITIGGWQTAGNPEAQPSQIPARAIPGSAGQRATTFGSDPVTYTIVKNTALSSEVLKAIEAFEPKSSPKK